ncbi:hypothetical protein JKF63_06635 [Porcisia hertigi]|uniref:Uncharacterized protein n=1 Tax=Porcisia hertigi TaxID=2761500 RepID=A0A836IVH5_9TRYP|nr:hypothetical protein JKF63_06635 [Porcisia hertigi]
MLSVDPGHERVLEDPLLMLRLYKRVAYGLVPRSHPDNTRRFLPSFLAVDSRFVESNNAAVDAAALLTVVGPIFPTSLLAQREVCLLLRVLPLEEEEGEGRDGAAGDKENSGTFGVAQGGKGRSPERGIRPGCFMLALRNMIPFRTWQVSQTVATVRRAIQQSSVMSSFEEHVVDILDWQANCRRQVKEAAPPQLERWEALAFMEETCALSSSESHELLHYCFSEGGREAESHAITGSSFGCEVQLLHQLLFSEVIPCVAEYSLLMGRFAEASLDVGEVEDSTTGTLALQSSLASMDLKFPEDGAMLSPDLDLGTLVRAELTPRQFFYVCTLLHTGFRQEESDQLYYYLKDNDAGDGLLVANLLAAYRQYFPSVTVSVLQLVQAAVRQWVRRNAKDAPAFVELYSSLREWGTAQVPIKPFVKALRGAGVPNGISGVLDVELEWLRLKAPTRVDLLLVLCTPVPPSRAAVVRKLFDRLDKRNCGTVTEAAALEGFRPEFIEGSALRRQGVMWRRALEGYLEELGEGGLDYDVFAYFWYMISAGIEDDPTFTITVWQAFGLARDWKRSGRD